MSNQSLNKKSYFQGGGGVNEPTPKKKKYESEPRIVDQPRFVEPFYRNYDMYEVEGVDGPAKHGPGVGWHDMGKYKSIKEFLAEKRKKLKDKYKADDSWVENSGKITKKDPKMQARGALLSRLVKFAEGCKDSDIEYTDGRDAWICAKCLHMGANSPTHPTPTAKQLHDGKNHNPDHVNYLNNNDVNHIDFPIDDQIKSDPILGNSGSVSDSVPFGGQLDEYLTQPDFEGKSVDKLDFDRDYTENEKAAPVNLDKLIQKYLNPKETDLYGLPDGIDPEEDLDADKTVNNSNSQYGTTDSGNTLYDKIMN